MHTVDLGDTDVWDNYNGHVSLSVVIILGLVILVVIYVLYELYHRQLIWTPTGTACTAANRDDREADLPLEIQVTDTDTVLSLTRSRHDMHDMPSAWQHVHVDEIVV